MKVSVNWLKQFTDIDLPLDKLVEKIGSQLGAVEEVVELGKRYEGVVVVRVVTCDKHPNGDKLLVCKIDDGGVVKKIRRDTHGYAQVVTGAPNARAGMLAAWIPPGATVPSSHGNDAERLEPREIRGLTSEGMLASAKELGFGDDHSGLLEIDEDVNPGTPFAGAYRLDDHIIDIENKMFTHRPDLFGIIGVAREVAAITGNKFTSPGWYLNERFTPKPSGDELALSVKNEIPKLVPRFNAVAISGVKIGPSPMWLRSYLMRVGIRPINNVVDLTNFVMYETAQPLHAYDYDKLMDGSITIRHPRTGESLKLLDEQTIKLNKTDVVIASGSRAIGLGGVMGGLTTEVDEETKNIVLEAANFDLNAVRRQARAHGLFTEAATRFTKNQSPWQTAPVLGKLVDDVLRLAGGRVASRLIDETAGDLTRPKVLKFQPDFVNGRLGLDLKPAEMRNLLEAVEMKIEPQASGLSAKLPFWRTDIAIAEDIVEEVGRLHGFDRLPLKLPVRDLSPAENNPEFEFAQSLRHDLAAAGANELLTYSFVHRSLLEAAGQSPVQAFHLKNAISPDLQYYRMSLIPSLLEKVRPNVKAGHDKFVLFEIGASHIKGLVDDEKLPRQHDRLALVIADSKPSKNSGAAYFGARRYFEHLRLRLAIGDVSFEPLAKTAALEPAWKVAASAFEPSRAAVVRTGRRTLGIIGEPTAGLRGALKLPAYCAATELDLSVLREVSQPHRYSSLKKYPSLRLDMCFRTASDLPYVRFQELINSFLAAKEKTDGYQFLLTPADIYRDEKSIRFKQTTWHLEISHPERTMTTKEATGLVEELAKLAKSRLDAKLV